MILNLQLNYWHFCIGGSELMKRGTCFSRLAMDKDATNDRLDVAPQYQIFLVQKNQLC
jgi:hypothetical protein